MRAGFSWGKQGKGQAKANPRSEREFKCVSLATKKEELAQDTTSKGNVEPQSQEKNQCPVKGNHGKK